MEKISTAIVPTLNVRNGKAAIDFYIKAFGAVVLRKITDPDGAIVAEMSIGNAWFVVADESPAHGNLSPQSLGGTLVRIGLLLDDPDAVAAQAVAAGATEVYPVANQSYGYRLGHYSDPFGHQWELFRPL